MDSRFAHTFENNVFKNIIKLRVKFRTRKKKENEYKRIRQTVDDTFPIERHFVTSEFLFTGQILD